MAGSGARIENPIFSNQGLRRRCAPKHRNNRRETAGWDRIDHQEVFVLYCNMARAGGVRTPPALLISNLRFRISDCGLREGCASARGEVSKTLLTPGGTEA